MRQRATRSYPEERTVGAVWRRNSATIAATCLLAGACADTAIQTDGAPPAASMPESEAQQPAWLRSSGASVQDGIFTEEQSRRGELAYMNTCRKCHQRDLAGDFIEDAPPLVGDEFLSNWNPWTVGDLFEYMTTEMPPKPKDRQGVTDENYADILAFILQKNGFPAGPAELPPRFDPLVEIEIGR